MKNLGIAIVLVLFPLYRFITWILISNQSEVTTHIERLELYQNKYFFGINFQEPITTMVSLFLIVLSFTFVMKAKKIKLYVKVGYGFIVSILFFLNLWSLL